MFAPLVPKAGTVDAGKIMFEDSTAKIFVKFPLHKGWQGMIHGLEAIAHHGPMAGDEGGQ